MARNQSIWGGYGLERETLRVTANDRLAKTPHPFLQSQIQRDFCEAQVEVITPVCGSISRLMGELKHLDTLVRDTLRKRGEQLWLYSNPPFVYRDEEIQIAQYRGADAHKFLYRQRLEKRYGKRLMLFCGIHFNLSFSEHYLAQRYAANHNAPSIHALRNAL